MHHVHSSVARCGEPRIRLMDEANTSITLGIGITDRPTTIGRAVIDDDHLQRHIGLAEDRVEALLEVGRYVVDGDYDREKRRG